MSNPQKQEASQFCQLSNLIRKGQDFLPSELPTSRDILKYGLYLRETSEKDHRSYTIDQLVILFQKLYYSRKKPM